MTNITRRDIALAGLTMSVLPAFEAFAQDSAPVSPVACAPFWFVDPELRPAARASVPRTKRFEEASKQPAAAVLPALRKAAAAAAPVPLATVPFARHEITGTVGVPPVTVYVINARRGTRRGGILHMHGGGMVSGSAFASIRAMQDIAVEQDCAIVTVEYRLAPETDWQGSTADNYSALRWMRDRADDLGVDPNRIGVMGESAGGLHAALLAIAARDRGEIPLLFQMLSYPVLDDRTGTTRTPPAPIGTIAWTPTLNTWAWKAFLGQSPGASSVPAGAVPTRVANLAGLPPTFIGVGSIDLFAEEDMDFARRLIEAIVPVELVIVPGAFHGFDALPRTTSVARNFYATKGRALNRFFS
jgi:acetyl esterase/lipase